MSYQQLWQQLARTYDTGEAKAIARMLYEVRYGLSLSDLLMGRDADVPQQELQQLTERLEQHEPIQYVLGQADFCGRTFKVSPAVLIPRPETEELCQWVTTEVRDSACNDAALSILDVGTGSGCIAITLAAELPEAKVTAWDISEDALLVPALLKGRPSACAFCSRTERMAARVASLGNLVTPLNIFCTVLSGTPEDAEISLEVMPSVLFHLFISSIVTISTPYWKSSEIVWNNNIRFL